MWSENLKGMDRSLISAHLQCGCPFLKLSRVKSGLVGKESARLFIMKIRDLGTDEADILKLTEFANLLLWGKKTHIIT